MYRPYLLQLRFDIARNVDFVFVRIFPGNGYRVLVPIDSNNRFKTRALSFRKKSGAAVGSDQCAPRCDKQSIDQIEHGGGDLIIGLREDPRTINNTQGIVSIMRIAAP